MKQWDSWKTQLLEVRGLGSSAGTLLWLPSRGASMVTQVSGTRTKRFILWHSSTSNSTSTFWLPSSTKMMRTYKDLRLPVPSWLQYPPSLCWMLLLLRDLSLKKLRNKSHRLLLRIRRFHWLASSTIIHLPSFHNINHPYITEQLFSSRYCERSSWYNNKQDGQIALL